jgi:tRNA threonylcarbamoyl adenosine modification protein YeaZ
MLWPNRIERRIMILAIDTSSAACTVALFKQGECVASHDEVIGRGHSERLVPSIAELLRGRVPDGILVGVGPGSFTGIRVGIAAAHGMATAGAWKCSASLRLRCSQHLQRGRARLR